MLRGGPPPPEPGAGGHPFQAGGGMPEGFGGAGGFQGFGGMPQSGRTFHFSTGGGNGGFSFSNPDNVFADFLRQTGVGGGMGGTGGGGDMDDIFEQLGASGGRGSSGGRSRSARYGGPEPVRQQRAPSPEVSVVERPLPVTLEEMFTGAHKKMKMQSKVFDEATGKRTTRDKIMEMDIKPGLKKGSKIRFANVSVQEEGGRQDLVFVVEEVSFPS